MIEMISFLGNEMSEEHKFRNFSSCIQPGFGIFVSHLNFILPFTKVISCWWLITLTSVVCRSKFPRFAPLLNDARHILVAPLVFR